MPTSFTYTVEATLCDLFGPNKKWKLLVNFDRTKQIILLLFLAMRLGLCKTDNFTRMITLSVITLSGFHCFILNMIFLPSTAMTVNWLCLLIYCMGVRFYLWHAWSRLFGLIIKEKCFFLNLNKALNSETKFAFQK